MKVFDFAGRGLESPALRQTSDVVVNFCRLILEIVDPSNLTSIFFQSPAPYHGDKRTAYGQMLSFSLSQSKTSDPMTDPDGDVFIYSRFAQEPIAAALPGPPGLEATVYNVSIVRIIYRKYKKNRGGK